jgi:hypothetical protein
MRVTPTNPKSILVAKINFPERNLRGEENGDQHYEPYDFVMAFVSHNNLKYFIFYFHS